MNLVEETIFFKMHAEPFGKGYAAIVLDVDDRDEFGEMESTKSIAAESLGSFESESLTPAGRF